MEAQDLFEARTHGYHTCRVPGIIATPRGNVIVSAEARPGEGGDYDCNDVLLRRSEDGGHTFAPFVKLIDHRQWGKGPVSNFVMVPDRATGRISALFCHDYARVFQILSEDDGVNWSTPVEITGVFEAFRSDYDWQVCATGPGHGLQLRSGRMIVPVWMADGTGAKMGGHRGHRPSALSLVHSDDGGMTWERGEMVCRNGDEVDGRRVVNPSETIAVELENGSVLFNTRNESDAHRRMSARSPDGVSNWGAFQWDSELLEPVCMASLIRHSWPEQGKPGRILFANPNTLDQSMVDWARDRKNLTIRMSEDDGHTWPVGKVLEAGPSAYSDLAVLPDGTILCFYECGIITRMCDDRFLRLARFDLDWVYG